MYFRSFLVLSLAVFGASAAPLMSTAGVGLNGVYGAGVGPTVSETLVTPYHRTDSVTTPCGQSVVRTTAVPVGAYGVGTGLGFLGTAGGAYSGLGTGLVGNAGVYPGCFGAGGVYPGTLGRGLVGTGVGMYSGLGAGVIGAGIGGHGLV